MRAFLSALGALVVSTAGAGIVQTVEPVWAPDAFGGYASTHIVVKFQPYVEPTDAAFVELQALAGKWGVQEMRPVLGFQPRHADLAAKYGLDRYYVIEVPEGTDTPTMVADYAALSDLIEIAELDGVGGVADTIPNDPSFGQQYGLHNTGQVIQGSTGTVDADIDAPAAWDLHTGTGDITLAVVDSGVNAHTNFSARLITGWNTVQDNNTNTTDFDCPHGTHVAGIAGATGNDALGVAGVNWGVTLQSVKVLTGCFGNETDCGEGLMWAADNGANICTMSLQYYTGITFFSDAVNYAHDAGLLLIAATGNNQGRLVAFPAKFANCMAVGATNNKDVVATFSNYGPETDVSAPGENVYSTYYPNTYSYLSGTSMATPHVSGLASLIWSYNPTLTNDEIEQILKDTSEDKGTVGWDEKYGFGRVNAYEALLAANGGGGGDPIECADISRFRARCRNGNLRVSVVLADSTHDGETVTVDVNGTQHVITIVGTSGSLSLSGQSGVQTVTLVEPAGCVSAQTPNCN